VSEFALTSEAFTWCFFRLHGLDATLDVGFRAAGPRSSSRTKATCSRPPI
jgi:hypothetical protein